MEASLTLTEMSILATAVLVLGMADDFRSRKVHNELILFLIPVVIGGSFYFRGIEGTLIGLTRPPPQVREFSRRRKGRRSSPR